MFRTFSSEIAFLIDDGESLLRVVKENRIAYIQRVSLWVSGIPVIKKRYWPPESKYLIAKWPLHSSEREIK